MPARDLYLLFQSPGGPALVLHGPHADHGGESAVLSGEPESDACELQEKQLDPHGTFPMAVISVPWPREPEVKDFYVICGCGWCSLSLILPPSAEQIARHARAVRRERGGVLLCDACQAKRDGRHNFDAFAMDVARRGCSTVADMDGGQ